MMAQILVVDFKDWDQYGNLDETAYLMRKQWFQCGLVHFLGLSHVQKDRGKAISM